MTKQQRCQVFVKQTKKLQLDVDNSTKRNKWKYLVKNINSSKNTNQTDSTKRKNTKNMDKNINSSKNTNQTNLIKKKRVEIARKPVIKQI